MVILMDFKTNMLKMVVGLRHPRCEANLFAGPNESKNPGKARIFHDGWFQLSQACGFSMGFPWFSMVFLNMALKRCRKNSQLNGTMTINSRLVGKSGPTMSHRLSQHCRLPRFQCTWMVSTRMNSIPSYCSLSKKHPNKRPLLQLK